MAKLLGAKLVYSLRLGAYPCHRAETRPSEWVHCPFGFLPPFAISDRYMYPAIMRGICHHIETKKQILCIRHGKTALAKNPQDFLYCLKAKRDKTASKGT
jgi:hypothetical protein